MEPVKKKVRVLITGGAIETTKNRLYSLQSMTLPPEAVLQINLDRNKKKFAEQLPVLLKNPVQWRYIPVYGTAWELQEAVVTTHLNQETLLIPLIPERALKLYLVEGNKSNVWVIPVNASFFRRSLEFLKSYLGWVAPEWVQKWRHTYYHYDH